MMVFAENIHKFGHNKNIGQTNQVAFLNATNKQFSFEQSTIIDISLKKKYDYFVQPLTSLLSDRFWRFWA